MALDKNTPIIEPVLLDPVPHDPSPKDGQTPPDQQDAIRVADAITATWCKKSLIITYASMWMQVKARSTRSVWESVWYYVVELDVIGILLMVGGLILFLTSFNIAGNATGEWKSPKIIAMMVVGFATLVAFIIYERYGAPKPFIPYNLLTNLSYYCWSSYFTSFLQVVYNISLTQAGYISSIFDLMDPVWLIGYGYLIRITGRLKWILMCAVSLYLLASGLMIYFRTPGHSVGYMCMCQIFLAVGGGTMILIKQLAVLAASNHEDYAGMLALLSTFGSIGGAVGSSVSGAIWTNTLPKKLREYLPDEMRGQWDAIYESLDTQLRYPVGSATGTAIQNAYASSQRSMMIAGTAVTVLSVGWVAVMRNIYIKERSGVSKMLF